MSKSFVFPPGYKAGCNWRTSKVGGVCSIWGEKMEVMTTGEIEEAIAARKAAGVKGRAAIKMVLNQGSVGSCATEACAQGGQSTRVRQNLPFVQLNPWFLYYHASGGVDRGSSIDEDLSLLRDIGCASEAVWPRSKGWRTKPSEEAYADALNYRVLEFYDITSVAEARTALVKDFFVQFGHDSHSELMVDIWSTTVADVVNSWGDWEDGGYHRNGFPFSRIGWGYGAFAFRVMN